MKDVKKILIIRLSSFGDIVLTFPLINVLKKKFPVSHITFLAKQKYEELLRLNPKINEIILLPEKNLSETRHELAAKNYDLVIDLQNNPKSRIVTSGLSNVYRFKKNNFKKFLLVKFKINLLKDTEPVYKRYIRTVSDNLGIVEDEMGFSTSELGFSKNTEVSGQYAVVAPSSLHFTKTYPKEKFIDYINRNPDRKFILVGDNSIRDTEICSFISESASNTINLCGKLTFSELAGILSNAEYVICNDSGILHLAEALGKSVTAIFGSTVKEFGFFPQLTESRAFENIGLKCRPCTHIGLPACPLGHFKCMEEVDIG